MCLAVPARIVTIDGENAIVELEGVRRSAVIAFIDDPQIGDYVLLHAGFAIRKWSEADFKEFQSIMEEMAQINQKPAVRDPS